MTWNHIFVVINIQTIFFASPIEVPSQKCVVIVLYSAEIVALWGK